MLYRFLDCVVDIEKHKLLRGDQLIEVEPQVFAVLAFLLERRGALVSRDELLDHCWQGVHVSDGTLTQCLSRVRRAIGHGPKRKLVETVHRKGYRFVGDVSVLAEAAPATTERQIVAAFGDQSDSDAYVRNERPPSTAPGLAEEVVSAAADDVSRPVSAKSAKSEPRDRTRPSKAAPLGAERRQLTILHCRRIDDELALDLEEIHERGQALRQLFESCLRSFDGHLAHALQNDLTAYFGYPKAQADSARRAVLASLRLVDRLASQDADSPLTVRIGIHTGEVISDVGAGKDVEPTITTGPAHEIALRLSERADAQSILVSETTVRLIERTVDVGPAEAGHLPGGKQPLACYRVLGERIDGSSTTSPGRRTPFVGRETELAWLQDRWSAVEDGIGQMALIIGEAGVGKSRLVGKARDEIAGHCQTVWECQCSPYHRHSAFFPIARLMQRLLATEANAGLGDDASIDVLAGQAGGVAEGGKKLAAALLSPPARNQAVDEPADDPQQRHRRVLNQLTSFFLDGTRMRPSLLIIEDVHWADPSTVEWIGQLANQVPTSSLLVLLTCRPEFEPVWISQADVAPLRLNRMSRQQTRTMLSLLTDGKPLPAAAVQQVSAKTDGVPLFIEEFTRALLESGQLQETDHGYELTWPIDQLSIPLTLHESLMERLDKLSTGKIVAQWGAVLGREFAQNVLEEASPLDHETRRLGLKELLSAGLIYQQGPEGEALFRFKHALVRDVAYQSILSRQRRKIHRDVAQLLETGFPDLIATQPELIAQHYADANEFGFAIPYWTLAGERAARQGAYEEAIEHLTRGLDALQDQPETEKRLEQELRIRVSLGPCLSATRGPAHPNVEHCFERALAICWRRDDSPHLFPTLANLWRLNHSGARYRRARRLGEQLLTEAERRQDPRLLQSAHQALGTSLVIMGELQASSTHLERSLSLVDTFTTDHLDSRYSHDPTVLALAFSTLARLFRGDPGQAIAAGGRLDAFSRELQHPHSQVLAMHFCMNLYWYLGDLPKAHHFNERKRAMAVDYGFPHFVGLADIFGGWLMAKEGMGNKAVRCIEQGLADFTATGSVTGLSLNQSILADGYGMVGLIDRGLETLDVTLALVERTGERFAEAEIYRLKGELLLKHTSSNFEEAEARFRQALMIARKQKANWWELRAIMSLANLWIRQDKPRQAQKSLTRICRRFAETIDSPYVQQAKALLAELTPA